MSKEDFKTFVRKKPQLANYVKERDISWQKLYETYELYGENSNVWDNYTSETRVTTSINEIINTIKNIDLDRVQNGIESIQNTISMIQNFGSSPSSTTTSQYEPRYKYKHLDD